jgi:hypothetical protein
LSCDVWFLRRFRHVGYPDGQCLPVVKCTGEMGASVSQAGMSDDARHCATRGPRGQLKGGVLCGRNTANKRFLR